MTSQDHVHIRGRYLSGKYSVQTWYLGHRLASVVRWISSLNEPPPPFGVHRTQLPSLGHNAETTIA